MTASSFPADTAVLMATRHRVPLLEHYWKEGFWDGIPVHLVADGVPLEELLRLKTLAARHETLRLDAYRNPRGVAFAKTRALQRAGSPYVLFCDDDDLMTNLPAFAHDAREALQHENVLFVTTPFVYAFDEQVNISCRYDRRPFAGQTGMDLLAYLVRTGEMSVLMAGSLFRREELVEVAPEPVFDVSEDLVMLARLCARYPDRTIDVAEPGRYLRLIHKRSLTALGGYTVEKAVMHLVALTVAAYWLHEADMLQLHRFLAIVQQRGQALQQTYGLGADAAAAVIADLTGASSVPATTEGQGAAAFLTAKAGAWPEEYRTLQALCAGSMRDA